MSSIRLNKITKYFDQLKILDSVDLEVNEGEMVALVGPSGSGKTTSLRIIAGLVDSSHGEVFLDGLCVNRLSTKDRGAVVVFQDYALFPHLNVSENVAFGLKMRGVKKFERDQKAIELLQLVQLEEHARKFPGQLSGGQKQRVAIARALAIEPKVLLLDEPFSNLDASLRATMRDFIRNLQKKLGITCILVTHDTQDALMTADRIAVLFNGVIEQYDTPRTIYKEPVSKRVADFFGESNYEVVSVENKIARSLFGDIPIPVHKASTLELMVRPENLSLVSKDDSALCGTVLDVIFCGERVNYLVDISGQLFRVIDDTKMVWAIGERVGILVNINDLNFFDAATGERI